MARWIRDEELNQPQEFVEFMMNDFLKKNCFKPRTRKGEAVWQNGDGFIIMARYIRYEYVDGKLHLEAWIGKFKENAMTGFTGKLAKNMFKASLEELLTLLKQPLPQGGMDGNVITVQVEDHGKFAVWSLVLSIMGILFAFVVPLLGIVCGCFGIVIGQRARNSSKNKLANVAVAIGMIAIVVALILWILNAAIMFKQVVG